MIDKNDLTGRYGAVTESLWKEVDRIRSEDGQIVFYEYEGE